MKNLWFQSLKWDAFLIYKYGIVAVALAIAFLYSAVFLFLNTQGMEKMIALLIFTDPVMYGFLFTAVMLLFEKDSNTHQVLAITPLSSKKYLLSKVFVFTALALVTSSFIILAAYPTNFHAIIFVLAVCLSSSLFIFIGIIGVSFVQNFNQFILIIPLVLAPVCFPFLDYFDWFHSWMLYVIPSQACLILFAGSVSSVSTWKLVYAILYLTLWNVLAYHWALKSYQKRILKTDLK
ncbi:MAG: ABC transporter permease [Salinivirgaceae bacterium]|nr:ABC transporter permease [Salinivirgaceae bacterium]